MDESKLNVALVTWLLGAQEIIDKHFERVYPDNSVPQLSIVRGKRWIKIVNTDTQVSVHCFIDPQNGDVLKAASWERPAKYARGNLFDESGGLACMKWTGTVYLR